MNKVFLTIIFAGILSICGAQNETLVIIHTNDTHSQIDPYSHKNDVNVGGYLRRDAAIKEIRKEHPYTLLLDAGDFSQGTPYFNVFGGYVEVKLMNKMGYDAATLGNHEFDNGCAALAKRLKKAKFPVLCANYKFAEKKLEKVIKPYTIVKRGDLKIGIFGLAVDLEGLVAPDIARDIQYLDPVKCAEEVVKVLKNENCDMIICLSHIGVDTLKFNDLELAKQVPEIDVIIGGHSHEELKTPIVIGKTRICQMTNRGKCFGVLELKRN